MQNGGIFKYSPEYSLTTYLNFVSGSQSLRQFLCAFNNIYNLDKNIIDIVEKKY
jgi:hypothetical protein